MCAFFPSKKANSNNSFHFLQKYNSTYLTVKSVKRFSPLINYFREYWRKIQISYLLWKYANLSRWSTDVTRKWSSRTTTTSHNSTTHINASSQVAIQVHRIIIDQIQLRHPPITTRIILITATMAPLLLVWMAKQIALWKPRVCQMTIRMVLVWIWVARKFICGKFW